MFLTLRRPAAGQLDGELIALAVLVVSGALGAAWLLLGLPTPACPFHQITGFPCLTCGGTRCLRSLLGGDPAKAFGWNPLVFVGAITAALFALYAMAVIALRLPRVRLRSLSPREGLTFRLLLGLAAAANWIYLVRHFSAGA